MSVKRYRTKPVEIEAVKFEANVDSYKAVKEFVGEKYSDQMYKTAGFKVRAYADSEYAPVYSVPDFGLFEPGDAPAVSFEVYDFLQKTWVKVNVGDYIIKGTKGEFYPCDPETFEWKYEEV